MMIKKSKQRSVKVWMLIMTHLNTFKLVGMFIHWQLRASNSEVSYSFYKRFLSVHHYLVVFKPTAKLTTLTQNYQFKILMFYFASLTAALTALASASI